MAKHGCIAAGQSLCVCVCFNEVQHSLNACSICDALCT